MATFRKLQTSLIERAPQNDCKIKIYFYTFFFCESHSYTCYMNELAPKSFWLFLCVLPHMFACLLTCLFLLVCIFVYLCACLYVCTFVSWFVSLFLYLLFVSPSLSSA